MEVRTESVLVLLRTRMVQVKYMTGERRKCGQKVCLSSRHVKFKLSVRKMKGERSNWKLGNTTGREVERWTERQLKGLRLVHLWLIWRNWFDTRKGNLRTRCKTTDCHNLAWGQWSGKQFVQCMIEMRKKRVLVLLRARYAVSKQADGVTTQVELWQSQIKSASLA